MFMILEVDQYNIVQKAACTNIKNLKSLGFSVIVMGGLRDISGLLFFTNTVLCTQKLNSPPFQYLNLETPVILLSLHFK